MGKTSNKRPSIQAIYLFKGKELADIKEQSQKSADDIQFYLNTFTEFHISLDFTIESLVKLEAIFRDLASKKQHLSVDYPFEIFTRLVGLYLGEVLIKQVSGAWAIYAGNNHTLNRIVVKIGDKYCDPLRFGSVLEQAKGAFGAMSGKAMHCFATRLDSTFT